MEEYPASAKIIVYRNSIATNQEVSTVLNCHRDVGDAVIKKEIRRHEGVQMDELWLQTMRLD